jgi:magnesium transporter
MLLDLKFSIGTLGIGSGAFVASLYGMNLKNFLEDSSMGFMGVTAWSFVFAIIVVSYGLKKLRRVQRVSMWGERGKGDRGSWRQVEPGWEGREARLKRLRQGDGGHGATEADRIVRERMAGVAPPALSPVPLSSPAAAAAATQAAARASAQAGTRRLKG